MDLTTGQATGNPFDLATGSNHGLTSGSNSWFKFWLLISVDLFTGHITGQASGSYYCQKTVVTLVTPIKVITKFKLW